jgi:hypothetical protein
MANNDDFLKVLMRGTLQYPKLSQTHRFNTQKQASEPCAPTASNAAWSVEVEMPKEDAKPIYEALKAHYEASRARSPKMPQFAKVFGMKKVKDASGTETGMVRFAAKRNGTKKDGSANAAPTVIDGQKQPLADLAIWGGSKGTVRAWAVAVVDPDGLGGISLLLDAVQVTEAVYGGNGLDDFETVAAKDDPFEKKPLNEQKRQSIADDLGDDIPFDFAA